MEPQYKMRTIFTGNVTFVGGVGRFDLYVGRFPQRTYVRVLWGPSLTYSDEYTVHGGKLRLSEFQWRDREFPTGEERALIQQYLHLFVPDLNIKPQHTTT